MKQHLFPGTYIIVPSICQEKTVQILDGRTEKGNKVVVCDRISRGRRNYSDQLWLWDGSYFRCAKHPTWCIKSSQPALTIATVGSFRVWRYNLGIITVARGAYFWHLKETANNSPVESTNRLRKRHDCFWKLEQVPGAEQVNLGFWPIYQEITCVIVPAMSPGKTIHLERGRTEKGTKITLLNRKPVGHNNYLDQLWLWDGKYFRSAKDPSKCLYCSARSHGRNIQLDDFESASSKRGSRGRHEWVVTRNNVTGLCLIQNYGLGLWKMSTPGLEGHNHTPVCLGHLNFGAVLWEIEMVPKGPERCGFTPTPSHSHGFTPTPSHSHL